MNIDYARSLPIGNAIELVISVDPDMRWVQVLRRLDATFPGPEDASATFVYNAAHNPVSKITQIALCDTQDIDNGVPLFYQAYGHNGHGWIASDIVTVTAQHSLIDRSVDPLLVVRDRLKYGLQAEIAAQRLMPASGYIPVWTAPPQEESTSWPVVTIKLDADRSAERMLGETLDQDSQSYDAETWLESEGWISSVSLTVIGWSQNPDERIALRQALKRIMLGNLPVFAAHGLITPDWSQQDNEDFESFNAPVYQTVGTFTCLASSMVSWTTPSIHDITVIGKGLDE